MIRRLRIFTFLVVGVLSLVAACQVSAYSESTSLGYFADNIYGTTSIIARLMWAACVIVGISLLITAFTQIQIHRNNPKLMPLTTPVTYMLLGLAALAIPFAERIFGFEDANTANSQGTRIQSSHSSDSYRVKRKASAPKKQNMLPNNQQNTPPNNQQRVLPHDQQEGTLPINQPGVQPGTQQSDQRNKR